MAHWAEVNSDNKVTRVLVFDDNQTKSKIEKMLGGNWIQTSYNTYRGEHLQGKKPLRKNFAGIGYTYDPDRDAFIEPKLYDSWVLNEEGCFWEPPVPKPEGLFEWSEDSQNWIAVESEPSE